MATDTLIAMETRGGPAGGRYDEMRAESTEALAYVANTLRTIRDRFHSAYLDEVTNWEGLRDDLKVLEHEAFVPASVPTDDARAPADGDQLLQVLAAEAAEAGAADGRLRIARSDEARTRATLANHESELARLELAIRSLEATWLFLKRGDASLVTDASLPQGPAELQMRIVEAQEAERARLAQEVHDGPAQALSNAIFQVEFIDRVFDTNPQLARTELCLLRVLLRRELGDVRGFIGQLRPPVLMELGLDGSIADAVSTTTGISGLHVETDLQAPTAGLPEAAQTVALRVVQEALQNVRKHAAATNVMVASMLDGGEWVLEIRDDGRGFDTGAVASRGRRNFGLQFMRERAELIGARFEVRSRPEAGTIVRLAIPLTQKESG